MELKFRKLHADEIEARVSTVNKNGCSLLLYKDARVDQNVLDETVGPMNWQRDHKLISDRLYCTVGIWDADKEQWIQKSDVGTESYTEKEKGQASDSFKRACFNWGIGRELYSAPFIWIKAGDVKIEEKGNGVTTRDRFKVASIGYDDKGKINSLVVEKVNNYGDNTVVYQWGNALYGDKPKKQGKKKAEPVSEDTSTPVLATKRERGIIYSLCGEDMEKYTALCKQVGCDDPKRMTAEQYAAATNVIRNQYGN